MPDSTGWSRFGEFGRTRLARHSLTIGSIKKRHLRTYPQPRPRQRGAKELERRIKEWDSAIGTLNPEVALKITSKVVQAIMARW